MSSVCLTMISEITNQSFYCRANVDAAAGGIIFFILYLPYSFMVVWEESLEPNAKIVSVSFLFSLICLSFSLSLSLFILCLPYSFMVVWEESLEPNVKIFSVSFLFFLISLFLSLSLSLSPKAHILHLLKLNFISDDHRFGKSYRVGRWAYSQEFPIPHPTFDHRGGGQHCRTAYEGRRKFCIPFCKSFKCSNLSNPTSKVKDE